MDSIGDLKKWAWDAKVEWIRTGQRTNKIVHTPIELAHWIDILTAARWVFDVIEEETSVSVNFEFLSLVYERE